MTLGKHHWWKICSKPREYVDAKSHDVIMHIFMIHDQDDAEHKKARILMMMLLTLKATRPGLTLESQAEKWLLIEQVAKKLLKSCQNKIKV